METKEIVVNGRKFTVRELKALESDDIDWTNHKEAIKKQVMISTGLTEEEYKELTIKERLHILDASNELNGIKDFQNPTN